MRIQVSQGSAPTDSRWSGRFNTTFLSSRSENTTVKELLKSAYICQSYCKHKSATLFETQCTCNVSDSCLLREGGVMRSVQMFNLSVCRSFCLSASRITAKSPDFSETLCYD